MAHGEVTHSAENERCVLCDQGQQHGDAPARNHHRLVGPRRLTERAPREDEHDRAGGQPAVDGDRANAVRGRGPTCQSEQDGWAGAHRHGAVRPRKRKSRRERPPRRWC